uniref:MARVEL domain-containing protein n=1 Tax=Amphiprion ocellaris TaxID=80972 RepID=A0AAQ5YPB0_AMPOC
RTTIDLSANFLQSAATDQSRPGRTVRQPEVPGPLEPHPAPRTELEKDPHAERDTEGFVLSLLIAFLCVYCVHGWPSWHAFCFFEVVALWFLLAFLIFLLMHLFRLQGKMPCINWPLTEFFHYSVGCVLLFIASIIASVKSGGVSALVAGSVFGFIATFLMAVNLWTSYSMACGPQAGASV